MGVVGSLDSAWVGTDDVVELGGEDGIAEGIEVGTFLVGAFSGLGDVIIL